MKYILPIITAFTLVSCGKPEAAKPEAQSLDSKVSSLATEKEDLSLEIQKANDQVAFITEQMDSVEAINEDIKTVYEGQVDSNKESFNQNRGEIAALEIELEFATVQEAQGLRDQIADLERESSALDERLSGSKRALEVAKEKSLENVAILKSELEETTAKYEAAAAKSREMEESNAKLVEQIAGLQAENDQLTSELADLNEAGEALEADITEAQAKIVQLNERIAVLEGARVELNGGLDGLNTRLKKAGDQFAVALEERDDYLAKIEVAMKDLKDARVSLETKKRQRDALKAEIDRI